jgi:hypothetical protein
MSTFNFTLPNGTPFEIKGPAGLTLEQAKAIFDKQAATGSLVGIKPGQALSAATQAAQGLASAQAVVAQAQSSITGVLGAGIPGAAGALGTVTAALGAAGGALGGSLSGVASGLTGAVGAAVTQFKGTALSVGSSLTAVLSVGSSLTAVAGSIGSTASKAISTINQSLTSAVSNPINIADYAKGAAALTSIGSMDSGTVTGVLAQAKKSIGQAADTLTSEKGLGAFGFGAEQLEKAGILKPGMSKFVTLGTSTLTNLLKSPAAFTGKDGIKSAADLLNNPIKQAAIQQDLMAQGLAGLKAVGIPTDLLSAQGLAGTALNAAKSIPAAADFLKGIPIPGDIGGKLTKAFDTNVRDGAFAANLAKTKIPLPFKAEVTPVPAADTVDRATVNAASTRVVGNDKVPEPNYGPTTPPAGLASQQSTALDAALAERSSILIETANAFASLVANLTNLESQQSITEQQWTAINAERDAVRASFNSRLPQVNAAGVLYNNALESVRKEFKVRIIASLSLSKALATVNTETKARIAELSKKRDGVSVT